MANTHEILIKGKLPYDIIWREKELEYWFALMNAPSIAIGIEYGKTSTRPIPNSSGIMTYYDFTISGQEAVRGEQLDKFVELLKKGGAELTTVEIEDIEA